MTSLLSTTSCLAISDCYTERIRAFTVAIVATSFTLSHIHMFTIQSRNSSAVECIHVNPITGDVNVVFTNGLRYEYDNVSRRAIVNLMLNPNMSLGFWVNDNCVNSARTSYAAA